MWDLQVTSYKLQVGWNQPKEDTSAYRSALRAKDTPSCHLRLTKPLFDRVAVLLRLKARRSAKYASPLKSTSWFDHAKEVMAAPHMGIPCQSPSKPPMRPPSATGTQMTCSTTTTPDKLCCILVRHSNHRWSHMIKYDHIWSYKSYMYMTRYDHIWSDLIM